MAYNTTNFLSELEKLNISLSEKQISQFISFYEILVEKNQYMNLTAITEFDEVIIKHFIDSVSLIKALPIDYINNSNILDVGTGAGFPGIPLKIAFPEINITLLDSLNKRVDFLQFVIDSLELNSSGSIKAIHSRAEDYIKEKDIRESFSIVVSRAVANLSTLSEYCLPYVKENGYFIPYKTGKNDEEIESSKNAINILGGSIEDICSFDLFYEETISRSLIKIKKTRPTPDKYPRKAGQPSKKPLT